MTATSTPDLVAFRAEMRARAEKATPGRWEVSDRCFVWSPAHNKDRGWWRNSVIARCFKLFSHDARANAAHIAASCPANVIAVLDADAATIERLTQERDEALDARDDSETSADTWFAEHKMSEARAEAAESRLAELTAELETARGRVAELAAALEPFADAERLFADSCRDASVVGGLARLRIGDLRRAARVLAEHATRKAERDGGEDA